MWKRADTLRCLIFRPFRTVAKNLRCSRLCSPPRLSRLCGCFGEPVVLIKHPASQKKNCLWAVLFFGGRGWIRTTEVSDGRFTVCSLWPLGNSSLLSFGVAHSVSQRAFHRNGAGERTRTPDLLITNQLLYQLSYTSISQCLNNIAQLFSIVKRFFSFFL